MYIVNSFYECFGCILFEFYSFGQSLLVQDKALKDLYNLQVAKYKALGNNILCKKKINLRVIFTVVI